MKKEPIAVRLSEGELKLLDRARKRLGKTRSDVVREAVVRYAEKCLEKSEKTVAERWAPWIGIIKNGDPNLSRNTSERWRQDLMKKHGRRSR